MSDSKNEIKAFSTDDKDFEKLLTELGAKPNEKNGMHLSDSQFNVTKVDGGHVVTRREQEQSKAEPAKAEAKFTVITRDYSETLAQMKEFSTALDGLKKEVASLKATPATNDNAAPCAKPLSPEEEKKKLEEMKAKDAQKDGQKDNAMPMPKDGKCPPGYKLSDDGKSCILVAQMSAEQAKPTLTKESDHGITSADLIIRKYKRL